MTIWDLKIFTLVNLQLTNLNWLHYLKKFVHRNYFIFFQRNLMKFFQHIFMNFLTIFLKQVFGKRLYEIFFSSNAAN